MTDLSRASQLRRRILKLAGERTLLRIILRGLKQAFGPIRQWRHLLVLDRGYWGAEYLLGLHPRYGMNLVTRAGSDELAVVANLNGLAQAQDTPWQWHREEHSHLGEIQVRCVGFEEVALSNEQGREVGRINAVVADEFDLAGRRFNALNSRIARRERNRIVHTLREGLARGESLERMLDRLENTPPRQA